MNQLFSTSSTFASLSLHDLISAREEFHLHLMSKKNVVATALGLYRIRKDDPWPKSIEDEKQKTLNKDKKKKERRTLFNSEIRAYSWPCIYVFVSDWEEEDRLAKENPSDVVPKTIFTKHRAVPVCVIEAKKQSDTTDLQIDTTNITPRNFYAPGSMLINPDAQGRSRVATAGCIVKDGERYYALTNKHAIGKAGTKIFAAKGTSVNEVGVTAKKGVTKKLMKDIYPHFDLEQQYLQMDLGLVDLHDITEWKTDVSGIDNVADVLDLYDTNLTLQLLGKKVVGRSAVTGFLRGEIQGLFYRYKSMGGFEYIADFVIGPDTTPKKEEKELKNENIALKIHHGDSGTLLFIENEEPVKDSDKIIKKNYPFAVLWGKNEFFQDKETNVQPFGLATALSTTFEVLDIDFVQDINRDNDFVWGYIGHFAIGAKLGFTVNLLKSTKLKSFIEKNESLLSLDQDNIAGNSPRVIRQNADKSYDVDHPQFVQLADVPDNVWKGNVNIWIDSDKKRHQGPGTRGDYDNPNHFCDIDLDYKGVPFVDFNLNDPKKNLNPKTWLEYYDFYAQKFLDWGIAQGKDPAEEKRQAYKHRGALPFRVQQLYNIMVKAIENGEQDKFLTAGGVLIHYIGDACQPLHTSYLSQGDPDDLIDKPDGGKIMRADKVHSGYEDDMVEFGYTEKNLIQLLNAEITRQHGVAAERIAPITNGLEAATAVLKLAKASQKTIPPKDIVEKWASLSGIKGRGAPKKRNEEMWDAFGKGTVECMARGCRYLAAIWQGAWVKGDGDTTIGKGEKQKESDIKALYDDPEFAKSNRLTKFDLEEPVNGNA